MYSYNANLTQFDWFPNSADSQTDFFFAWKMIAITVVGCVMTAILLYRHFCKKELLQFENSFYCLIIYGLFVLMSALFSTHKYWVIRGTYELFEPVWVVCAYMILCYYIYNFVNEEEQVKRILQISGIGMAVVTVIGVFQYAGLDFFKSSIGKHLIINVEWWEKLDKLSFNFPERTSYTTLYNPNFLSFYFGILIPLLLCLFIGTKKMWYRFIYIIAEILCVICLIGSNSMTGWIALAIGAVLVIMVLLSRRKKLLIAGAVIVAAGIIATLVLGNTTSIGRSVRDTIIGTYHMKDRFALNDVETNDDNVVLNIRGNKLFVSYGTGDDGQMQISCKDADGNDLSMTTADTDNNIMVPDDARFAEVSMQYEVLGDNIPAICVTIEGVQWTFLYTGTDGYAYLNPAGNVVKYTHLKQSNLFRDDAMSDRGHIWNKTIPLLGKHVFMGSGANTYMFEVPQEDYISQNYVYGANSYDVKAHCWYLQQWVETGLFGTLALLAFLIWYLIQSVRIYRRVNLHESLSWTGVGLFAAVLVYLLAAIVNDSNVCTAPVFWGMLGLGLAVNRMLVKKENLFVKEAVSAESDTAVKQSTPKAAESVKADTAQMVQNTEGAGVTEPSVKKKSSKKQSRKQRKNQK